MKHIEVAAAVIIRENTVFAAQRGEGGELARKWEFPGGKLEPGERGEEAIVREIMEELGTEVRVLKHLGSVDHQYKTFSLTLHGYLCTIIGNEPTLSEHLASRWLAKDELDSVPWAEADLPLVEAIHALLV